MSASEKVVGEEEALDSETVWTRLVASTAEALETEATVGAASSSVRVPVVATPPTDRL